MQGRRRFGTHRVRSSSHARNSGSPATFEVLEARQLLAGLPELVKDINRTTADSDPNNFVIYHDALYFITSAGALWKSDGTDAGTEFVKDLAVHPDRNSFRSAPVVFEDQLWFFGTDAQSYRLWKSDGTAAGTVVAMEANASPINSARGLTVALGTMYFAAGTPATGVELWTTDGTTAGTRLVKDIAPGEGSSYPSIQGEINGNLLFSADDGVHGKELWTSDGTDTGTTMVKDLNPGEGRGRPWYLTNVNGTLFFAANGPADGRHLWKTDGTAAGTTSVGDVLLPDTAAPLVNLNGVLYFSGIDSAGDQELWKSDGTDEGTTRAVDILPADSSNVRFLANLGGKLYFEARTDDEKLGFWESDGTASGTRLVAAASGSGSFLPPYVAPASFVNDTSLFVRRQAGDAELWRVDDIGGRQLTPNFGRSGAVLGDHYYFTSYAGVAGAELWKTDGTPAGTVLVKDLNPTVTDGSSWPSSFVEVGSETLFLAYDDDHGRELWKTDGTESGTVLVKDITPGVVGSDIYSMASLDGQLLIWLVYDDQIDNDESGSALWRSDGTPDGTELVYDFGIEGTRLNNDDAVVVGDKAYFGIGKDLWKTDGTPTGTGLVKDFGDEGFWSGPGNLTDVAGTLFFSADDGAGSDLWKSDGTEQGTVRVTDFAPDSSTTIHDLVNADGRLFFARSNGTTLSMWMSDGTSEGTKQLREFSTSRRFLGSANLNSQLLFPIYDNTGQSSLFVSDGTDEGTLPIRYGSAVELTEFNGSVYFRAGDPATGSELWRTDGTAAGTMMVKDAEPGADSSRPRQITNANGQLYFLGDNDTLWTSDGTAEGTLKISNDVPVEYLYTAHGKLYFSKYNQDIGEELWVYNGPTTVAGRHIFYNHSGFDGQDAAPNVLDDAAIASNKTAFVPGSGAATADSVSSYDHGINGIMIDLANMDRSMTADAFTFRVGTNNSPEAWIDAPEPTSLVVRPGAGVDGSDRVTIIWPDGAIKNTWLQVIVKGNDELGGFSTNTGLLASDVFYFGSRVGDTFENSPLGFAVTNVWDDIKVRNSGGSNQPITSLYDFNRDGTVNVADQIIARTNFGTLPMLDLGDTSVAPLLQPEDAVENRCAAVAFALALAVNSSAEDAEDWMDGVLFD